MRQILWLAGQECDCFAGRSKTFFQDKELGREQVGVQQFNGQFVRSPLQRSRSSENDES
jgi:hypothetical protein